MRIPAGVGRRGVCLLAAVGLVGAAPGSAPRAEQPPAFRAGVDLVAVDFLALAKDGSSIRDLRSGDVTLKVDGRARDVRSLQFIELAHAGDEGVVRPAQPPAVPFGSNRLADAGRAIVIAVDRDSIHPGQEDPIRSAVGHFLNRLTASDRVGFVTLPRSPNEVGLTRDFNRIREALLTMSGHAPQTLTDGDKICRSRDTVFALAQLIQPLAAVDGPKTLVLVSSGLLAPKQDFAKFNTPSTLPPLGSAPGPLCDNRVEYFDAVGAAAADARAHLYVVQSEVVRSDPSVTSADYNGLESLAGVTGGEVLPLLGGDEAFKRIARESAGYYLLAFEPEASDRNGASHRIELRVARDNVKVRSRPAFNIPKPRPAAGRANAREMLRDAASFRDLPLRVVAYASRNQGDSKLKVVAVAEPFDASNALTSASIGLIDPRERLTAQWTAEADDLKARPLAAALTVSPGRYRIRVAASDSSGRTGAADYDFDARLIDAGPLKISTMALGVVRNGQFAPALQFRDEQAAIAYLEIYGIPKAGSLSASLEIADATGIPVGTLPFRIIQTSDEDRRIATAVIPLDGLLPGDYLVQAVIGVADRPAAKAPGTLRKIAK